jgi:hypothetical protein
VLLDLQLDAPPDRAEIRRRFGDVADRVCAYFPGTSTPPDQVGALAGALKAEQFRIPTR